MLLESVYECILDAGYTMKDLAGTDTVYQFLFPCKENSIIYCVAVYRVFILGHHLATFTMVL